MKLKSKWQGIRRNPENGFRGAKVWGRKWRFEVWAFAAFVAACSALSALAQINGPSEYQVKAAFLFHFAQFVEWPAEAFKDGSSPLVYCTVGDDPFHGALDARLNGKTIGARAIRVEHFKRADAMQGCQVVFLGMAEQKQMSAALANMRGNPVLTVGESEHFAQEGGMIGFCLEENKVRFEINLNAATQAKLKISARLLTLAKMVIGGPKGT